MLCRCRGNLACNTAKPLLNQLFQRPACTVPREHREVMNVDIRISVRAGNLLIIDFREPVVCGDCPRVGQYQPAHRVCNRRVFLHAPVLHLHIAVHDLLVVEYRRLHVAHPLALLSVQDKRLGCNGITSLLQHLLCTVLNVLHMDAAVLHLALYICCHPQRKQINNILVILHLRRLKRLDQRPADFVQTKLCHTAISFYNLNHLENSFAYSFAFHTKALMNKS